MRYVMRQKLLSWGDDFVIQDESGRDVFFVDGKAFSLGNQLSFQDMQGNELAFIRQKLLAWGQPTNGVDIVEGEDDILILASTVVIDMACHERKDRL